MKGARWELCTSDPPHDTCIKLGCITLLTFGRSSVLRLYGVNPALGRVSHRYLKITRAVGIANFRSLQNPHRSGWLFLEFASTAPY